MTSAFSDHANVLFVFGGTFQNGDDAKMLKNAKDNGMGAILDIENVFTTRNPSTGVMTLLGDPATLWSAFQTAMESSTGLGTGFFNSGTVVAFHLGDEPPTDATTLATLTTVSHFLKTTFPNIPRMTEFTAWDIDTRNFQIPNDISWVGFDCYNPSPSSFSQCAATDHGGTYSYGSISYYTARLKTLIRKSSSDGSYHPRLVAFPAAVINSATSYSPSGLVNEEGLLLSRVEREIALTENDPDFVMIMPFMWTWNPTPGYFGVSGLPMALKYYKALGLHISSGGAQARLAYPTTMTGYAPGTGAANAFDYDDNTAWNSGQFVASNPSLWAAFADPIKLTTMSEVVDQSPAGSASHMISGVAADGTWSNIAFPSGSFSDFELLSQTFSSTLPGFAQIVTSTQVDPGWVAWRSMEFRTTGTTRLYAYPISATNSVTPMENITDGNTASVWNSGLSATTTSPVSIILDLGQVQTFSLIQLVVDQSPAGVTTHKIYGSPDQSTWVTLATNTANTTDGQTLSFSGSFSSVRFLKIETSVSPSWVAWRDISVFK